jgi:ATP-dependent helicase HrpA
LGRISLALSDGLEQKRPEAFDDLASQMADLVYPGFLADLEPGRLDHYPRYLAAVEERLLQMEEDPQRDLQRLAQIQPWWRRYCEGLERGCPYDEAMDRFRWLLEEYRVSLFAQRLGTAGKVSEKRLAEAWRQTAC